MIQKDILYFGKPCTLACDANCKKAFGNCTRPKVYLSGDPYEEGITADEHCRRADDSADLADGELGEAPADNGWTEGGHAKPQTDEERLNKWCARQCERSVIVDRGEPIVLPDYSKRVYNIAPHTRD